MSCRVSSVQLGEYWPCIGSDRWNEEAGTKIAALITAWSCTRPAPDQWLQWLKHQTMIGDQPAAEARGGHHKQMFSISLYSTFVKCSGSYIMII